MTRSERALGVAVLDATLAALLASGVDRSTQAGADLARQCKALSANAATYVGAGTFSGPLKGCFEAARVAGATIAGLDAARAAALATASTALAVQRVAQTAARYAIVEMCLISAATAYTSRQDVDAALATINAAFEPAEDFAAARFTAGTYRALVALHAATTRDLTTRARPLPEIVPYAFPNRRPALTLANRLYGDGGRAGDLLAENVDVVHPLFMPPAGRALSA